MLVSPPCGRSGSSVVPLSRCFPVTVATADALLLAAVTRWRWKVGALICLRRRRRILTQRRDAVARTGLRRYGSGGGSNASCDYFSIG